MKGVQNIHEQPGPNPNYAITWQIVDGTIWTLFHGVPDATRYEVAVRQQGSTGDGNPLSVSVQTLSDYKWHFIQLSCEGAQNPGICEQQLAVGFADFFVAQLGTINPSQQYEGRIRACIEQSCGEWTFPWAPEYQ